VSPSLPDGSSVPRASVNHRPRSSVIARHPRHRAHCNQGSKSGAPLQGVEDEAHQSTSSFGRLDRAAGVSVPPPDAAQSHPSSFHAMLSAWVTWERGKHKTRFASAAGDDDTPLPVLQHRQRHLLLGFHPARAGGSAWHRSRAARMQCLRRPPLWRVMVERRLVLSRPDTDQAVDINRKKENHDEQYPVAALFGFHRHCPVSGHL